MQMKIERESREKQYIWDGVKYILYVNIVCIFWNEYYYTSINYSETYLLPLISLYDIKVVCVNFDFLNF